MKTLMMLSFAAVLGASTGAFAANANHPYQNCDRRNDNCAPTGDDQTDRLNQQQLGGAPTAMAPDSDKSTPSATAPAPQN